ncbi:MAG: amino acid dehydrogenase [Planctomycetes bacterium]|nr:amino acid dehydrogenase [Planctomycetota bacterium]
MIAVHGTRHGPAFGGIRRAVYAGVDSAVADALRLAHAMTLKCMTVGVAGGGGKCVLMDHPDLDAHRAYRWLGRHIEAMGGRFFTGPDVGTGPEQLAALAQTTRFAISPGDFDGLTNATTSGVLAGLRAVARELDEPGLGNLSFVIQGVGGVGARVAEQLVAAGGCVAIADTDAARVAATRDQLGVTVIAPEAVLATECDVFVPCAFGGVLAADTIARLRCRAVAGSANNQLTVPSDARLLADRGILYAPDFMVSAGGLIAGAGHHPLWPPTQNADTTVDCIETLLVDLFARARASGVAPADLATAEAEQRLRAGDGTWFAHEQA